MVPRNVDPVQGWPKTKPATLASLQWDGILPMVELSALASTAACCVKQFVSAGSCPLATLILHCCRAVWRLVPKVTPALPR